MFELDIHKQFITIEGQSYSANNFKSDNILEFSTISEFHRELYDFLKQWFSNNETIEVKTSGSTGIPKVMCVEKSKMMQSAILTCSFLKLQNGDKALLCMPLQYIAGKMVVVRSLVCGLNLYPVKPSGNPLENVDISFDFAALVPLQVFNTLQKPIETNRLKNIKNLIIGGGAVDHQIEQIIKDFPNNVYSTYGMTETLSHIALRKLNGKDASENYFLFKGVNISVSEEETLIIDAPLVSDEILYTNDVVKIYKNGSFKILGRKDNVINTGGIKVQIEEVERIVKELIDIPFAITSLNDSKFGDLIVIVSEKKINLEILQNVSPSYYIPKRAFIVKEIPLTETGKIDRAKLKQMILN